MEIYVRRAIHRLVQYAPIFHGLEHSRDHFTQLLTSAMKVGIADRLASLQRKLNAGKSEEPCISSPPAAVAEMEGKVIDLQQTIRLEKLESLRTSLAEVRTRATG